MPRSRDTAEVINQQSDFVGRLLSMFPRIVFAVNQTLETASEGVSKKAGVVLWSIYFSGKYDEGRYLETKDIVVALMAWFAIKLNTANQVSNQARKELFKKHFIITREAPKRIYLTEAGEEFFVSMLARVRAEIEQLLTELTADEQRGLMAVLERTFKNGRGEREHIH